MSALANSAFFILETFAATYLPTGQYSGTLYLVGLAQTVDLATVAFHAFLRTSAMVCFGHFSRLLLLAGCVMFDVRVEGLRCVVCCAVEFPGVLWLGVTQYLTGIYRQMLMLAIAKRVSRVSYKELHGVASWCYDKV